MTKIRKAIVATIGTAAAVLGSTMLDGELAGGEVVAAIGTGLVVGFATWRVPNRRRREGGRRRKVDRVVGT